MQPADVPDAGEFRAVLEAKVLGSVHAGDNGVGGEEQRPVGRVDNGRIIADSGEALTKLLDQRELGGQKATPVTSTHRA